jgi:hypothetical protein
MAASSLDASELAQEMDTGSHWCSYILDLNVRLGARSREGRVVVHFMEVR